MSKIETYRKAKDRAVKLRNFATIAQDVHHCDKFDATVKLTGSYQGTYGSSSAYRWPDEIIAAMEAETRAMLRAIALKAAERAEREALSARYEAKAEAKEILDETDHTEGEKT